MLKNPISFPSNSSALLNFLVGIIYSCLVGTSAFGQNWEQISDFPGAERDDATGFRIGDSAYIGTGTTPWWSNQGDFYGFDLTTEQWFPIASLPLGKERQYASSFSHNGKGYVFGGFNGAFLNDLWCYNPTNDSWTELASLPSSGRSGSSCFVINDSVYIIGGKTSTNFAINEVWCYEPSTDSWSQRSNLPFGNCWRSSACQLNNTGYLVFGRDENNTFMNNMYAYNPATDTWELRSTFPSAGRSHASLLSLNDMLYLCFGIDSLNNSFNDLWRYDVNQDSWYALPGIPAIGRRGGTAIAVGNVFYYTTGINENNERLKETWKYSPELTIPELNNPTTLEINRIVDLSGRETTFKPNTVLFYQYSDGTTEKIFQIEE
jgi:N-acetylneuraminic acid mutarotase